MLELYENSLETYFKKNEIDKHLNVFKVKNFNLENLETRIKQFQLKNKNINF